MLNKLNMDAMEITKLIKAEINCQGKERSIERLKKMQESLIALSERLKVEKRERDAWLCTDPIVYLEAIVKEMENAG